MGLGGNIWDWFLGLRKLTPERGLFSVRAEWAVTCTGAVFPKNLSDSLVNRRCRLFRKKDACEKQLSTTQIPPRIAVII